VDVAVISGNGGNNDLIGTTTADTISGNNGNDTLSGLGGTDTLFGGADNDTLFGGADNDFLFGGTGTDTLEGGAGADSIAGGTGTDTVSYASSTDGVTVNLTSGTGSGGDAQGDTITEVENITGSGQADTLIGNGSNNTLRGGAGDDSLSGEGGADSIAGGDGNDTISGGTGGDTLAGEGGTDTLDYSTSTGGVTINLGTNAASGGDAASDVISGFENVTGSAAADNLTGTTGNNVLRGGNGNDQLFGGAGDDTLEGGLGADTLSGGTGMDYVDYSNSSSAVNINLGTGATSGGEAAGDVLSGVDGIFGSAFDDTMVGFDGQGTTGDIYTNVFYGGGGNDSLDGLGGNDTLAGGADNDTILGSGGDDSLSGDDGSDTLFGGTGNDTADGGTGADSVYGGDGNDSLSGGAGNDIVQGDLGNDTVLGGDGNDTIFGGDGNDTLFGGDGDDTLYGGAGSDTFNGGAGRDTFIIGAGDTVNGNEEGDDQDVLDLTGLGPLRVIRDPGNPENGIVELLDSNGNVTGTITFSNIETVIPCFTPGAVIDTKRGPVAVEDIVVGDRVLTRDNGFRTVRWVGRKTVSGRDLQAAPQLQPICIRRDAFGPGVPSRDLVVSRQHRMLMSSARAELLFGETEVLACAGHLVGQAGVTLRETTAVTYLHVMFDGHEVIRANGCWTESFQPGASVANAMETAARDEILSIFPELATSTSPAFAAARPTIRAHEARLLAT
jgi:Ca2+-binding RTX toxin-like protein